MYVVFEEGLVVDSGVGSIGVLGRITSLLLVIVHG